MIHSLFVINHSGDVFMEKHWRSIIPRTVMDYFFEAQRQVVKDNKGHEDVPCVIATPHHYLISIYRNGLYFVAVCMSEVPPLFVIEFLHTVVDILEKYFTECNESNIKEHYVVVYELLDEVLDNGYPLATEPNILQELIKPPNIIGNLINTVTGKSNVSSVLPSGQLSNVPWRRADVKYTNNEAYFDIIEEVDAIIDKTGSTVFAEIAGKIECCVRLSGTPDLTLSFINPRLMDDVSFHPCVRLKRWENERILSFVPPDGSFCLMTYHVGCQSAVAIPIYIRHNFFLPKENSQSQTGKIEITVGPRQTMGRVVENLQLSIPMPKFILNCTVTLNQGRATFDPVTKILLWEVGKIDPTKLPNMRGQIHIQSGAVILQSTPSVNVQFTLTQIAISGLKVHRLDMFGENYKPFKGVKYLTKAGNFQIRM
ncbi:hypothetical protein DAPPUDRAFT_129909 [Daphnia pulex]|uniref:MHD domain-containing protein n=1 Tax=Daphnia pulex TaxID=6669 RepID=E9HDE8_DAPPU|nr:hypothetical protein DAPPUDRAFT_129909 [Daphnia pulex]|eukprot:EFX70260.1 hypothetical protein DAPPUDRAFT_129909 [Daphnia pulex]